MYVDTSGFTWACRIAPFREEEIETDRDSRKSWFNMFLTEHAEGHITALSRVEVEGVTYEVFGDPKAFRHRNRTSHIECVLRTIEG